MKFLHPSIFIYPAHSLKVTPLEQFWLRALLKGTVVSHSADHEI